MSVWEPTGRKGGKPYYTKTDFNRAFRDRMIEPSTMSSVCGTEDVPETYRKHRYPGRETKPLSEREAVATQSALFEKRQWRKRGDTDEDVVNRIFAWVTKHRPEIWISMKNFEDPPHGKYFHFQQYGPEKFDPDSYGTKIINEKLGVKFRMGVPLKPLRKRRKNPDDEALLTKEQLSFRRYARKFMEKRKKEAQEKKIARPIKTPRQIEAGERPKRLSKGIEVGERSSQRPERSMPSERMERPGSSRYVPPSRMLPPASTVSEEEEYQASREEQMMREEMEEPSRESMTREGRGFREEIGTPPREWGGRPEGRTSRKETALQRYEREPSFSSEERYEREPSSFREQQYEQESLAQRTRNPVKHRQARQLGYEEVEDLQDDMRRVMSQVPSREWLPTRPRMLYVLEGSQTHIRVQIEGQAPVPYAATYILVDADDLKASHVIIDGAFADNPHYPYVQVKARTDLQEALRLGRSLAYGMEPLSLVFNTAPGKTGAPIIDQSGHVLYGNERILGMQLGYMLPGSQQNMLLDHVRNHLKKSAGIYGLNADEIDHFINPILVRQIDTFNPQEAAYIAESLSLSRIPNQKRRLNPKREIEVEIPGNEEPREYEGEFQTTAGSFNFPPETFEQAQMQEPLSSSVADGERLWLAGELLQMAIGSVPQDNVSRAMAIYRNAVETKCFPRGEYDRFRTILFGVSMPQIGVLPPTAMQLQLPARTQVHPAVAPAVVYTTQPSVQPQVAQVQYAPQPQVQYAPQPQVQYAPTPTVQKPGKVKAKGRRKKVPAVGVPQPQQQIPQQQQGMLSPDDLEMMTAQQVASLTLGQVEFLLSLPLKKLKNKQLSKLGAYRFGFTESFKKNTKDVMVEQIRAAINNERTHEAIARQAGRPYQPLPGITSGVVPTGAPSVAQVAQEPPKQVKAKGRRKKAEAAPAAEPVKPSKEKKAKGKRKKPEAAPATEPAKPQKEVKAKGKRKKPEEAPAAKPEKPAEGVTAKGQRKVAKAPVKEAKQGKAGKAAAAPAKEGKEGKAPAKEGKGPDDPRKTAIYGEITPRQIASMPVPQIADWLTSLETDMSLNKQQKRQDALVLASAYFGIKDRKFYSQATDKLFAALRSLLKKKVM